MNKFLPGAKNYEPTFYYIDGGYLNETLLDYDGNFELHGEANVSAPVTNAKILSLVSSKAGYRVCHRADLPNKDQLLSNRS